MQRIVQQLFFAVSESLHEDIDILTDEKLRSKGDDLPTPAERVAMERVQHILRQAVRALILEAEMLNDEDSVAKSKSHTLHL